MTRSSAARPGNFPAPKEHKARKQRASAAALVLILSAGTVRLSLADSQNTAPQAVTPYRAAVAGTQKVTIEIDGGFTPSSIWVKPGERTELTFVRKGGDGCGESLLLPSLGVKRTLRPGRKTTVTFTPRTTQVVRFTCGMKMYKGHVVVIPDQEQAALLARAVASGKGCCPE